MPLDQDKCVSEQRLGPLKLAQEVTLPSQMSIFSQLESRGYVPILFSFAKWRGHMRKVDRAR
jgi:hypothetical protein